MDATRAKSLFVSRTLHAASFWNEKGKSLQFPRFELCGGNSGAYAFYISRVPRKASELSWRMQGGIEAKVAAKFSFPDGEELLNEFR